LKKAKIWDVSCPLVVRSVSVGFCRSESTARGGSAMKAASTSVSEQGMSGRVY
jgi:hypothetical protein